MKPLKMCAALALSTALCSCFAFAGPVNHSHMPQPLPGHIEVSSWAAEGVSEAMTLGFGPTANEYPYLPSSLGEAATRKDICLYSARLMAFQQHCDEPSFTEAVLHYRGEKDIIGQAQPAFSDLFHSPADHITALYHLGVARGRGDGTFDAYGAVTRQEAATFIARVYKAYGGEFSKSSNAISYTDGSDISDWAKDSVNALSAAGIMKGYEDGRFAPQDLFSYEQCLLTLVRLYRELPVSRKNGYVKSLFTYEEYISSIEAEDQDSEKRGFGTFKIQELEGPVATFVQRVQAGGMHRGNLYQLIYRSGAVRSIDDFGVCDTGLGWLSAAVELQDLRFSEDGKTLFCTISLADEVTGPIVDALMSVSHSHEAGDYQIAIAVETCKAQAIKIEDRGTVL